MNQVGYTILHSPHTPWTCSEGASTPQRSGVPVGLHVQSVSLTFNVSSDEEHVHLSVSCEGRLFDLGARGHNYLLVTLARRRLADADDGHPPASCGWVHLDDLTCDPNWSLPILNLHIFRIRKQFAFAGLLNSDQIIERRRGARQLRIGTANLCVLQG